MKCIVPVLCLALLPWSIAAHASIDSNAGSTMPSPVQADAPVATPQPAPAQDGPRPQRRSVMAEAGPGDRPVMRFSAMYREVGRDPAGKDICLKQTGTRLKRDSNGAGACAIGSGYVLVPDR